MTAYGNDPAKGSETSLSWSIREIRAIVNGENFLIDQLAFDFASVPLTRASNKFASTKCVFPKESVKLLSTG